MTSADFNGIVDPRALAAALQATMAPPGSDGAYRAVLSEVRAAIPFAFGAVLRFDGNAAQVMGVYPAGMAGVDVGVRWSPLDGAERAMAASGEPSLDGNVHAEAGDASPLTRLPGFGMRSVLRVPLFGGNAVVGSVSLYTYGVNAFTVREGIALEQYVRALGARMAGATFPAAAETETPPSALAAAIAPPAPAAEAGSTSPAAPRTESGDERLSVLGELVSGVAHELNNPLTTILGYAQLLPSLEGEDFRRAIQTIEQEAQRAGRIVRNLLYFSRQHRPRVEPIDLNGVLARVVEVRRYNLEANNIHLATQFGVVPELLGDQYQLEQVFLNLVNNAQQALHPTGGTITITSESSGDVARVTVRDTGPGVPDELVQRIFEPFFTTREVGEGSGLGLSIAYGIVQSHGGRLLAQRAPGGGAEFIVELPLPPHAAPPAPPAAPVAERGAGERVLVVEDEAAVRSLISTVLGTSGYAVRAAESGDEAVRALEESTYDLVISDLRMPGLDGEGLYEQVQERWPHLQRRLLFISGDIEADRFAARLREHDVRYLEKPFSAARLLATVREVLDAAAPT
ncbi:MAG: ATP-binding protein [Dehalococcoidia bacterium]